MFRNIFRTSQCLARRRINNFVPVFLTSYKCVPIDKTRYTLESKYYSSNRSDTLNSPVVESVIFEEICNETLESLCDYFEEIIDESSKLKKADVTFSDGVLTVALGPPYGTYVINRQSPNKQIWLSSPVSGPKRYDLVLKDGGYWIYKHDGVTLHRLLQNEISKILNSVDFKKCLHSVL